MKIAVSATGPTMDSPVEERFGRCAFFVLWDSETGSMEAINNQGGGSAEGAGVKSAGLLLRKQVNTVLTGRVGPKAMQALQAGGVAVYSGASGTVFRAVEQYRNGLLKPGGIPGARAGTGKKRPELSLK